MMFRNTVSFGVNRRFVSVYVRIWEQAGSLGTGLVSSAA